MSWPCISIISVLLAGGHRSNLVKLGVICQPKSTVSLKEDLML